MRGGVRWRDSEFVFINCDDCPQWPRLTHEQLYLSNYPEESTLDTLWVNDFLLAIELTPTGVHQETPRVFTNVHQPFATAGVVKAVSSRRHRGADAVIGAFLVLVCGAGGSCAEETVLPQGNAPAALVSRHFPDRGHEFVWRNWCAVEPAKLASILGTSVDNVRAVAVSMGLPPKPTVPPEMRTRGYVTIIRRNWHLLPYGQLLELLDMTSEQLAFTLREDDFLWVKLGRTKPKCEPLYYQPPDEAARHRAAEIRRVVETEFGEEIRRPAEPRFEFVRQLSKPLRSLSQPKPPENPPVSLRYVYSYLAVYGDPLLKPELDPFPDGLLQRCSVVGVNGVWLHAVLRELAPGGKTFPEFGTNSQARLENLRALVRRAAKYGIGVYLYLNEPRAMPESFFKTRPDLAGVHEEQHAALCTSQPAVREWMTDALAHVFSNAPGLAGVFTITASENLTSCASHGRWQDCPRCQKRSEAEIIAEVNAAIAAGVHRANPKANVIVYDWGWGGWGDGSETIKLLPKDVWLMSLSEWDKPIERGGIKSKVNEYSISSVGPGPRAMRHWEVARQAGLRLATEIQFNNTCEIASLPYLPVMDLIAEHIRNLSPLGLKGMMIGWTMGGYPSPNFQLAQRLNRTPFPDAEAVLDQLARERFGRAGGPHARKAWTLMSDAFREYPFHIRVVYNSPVQIGPANALYRTKTGYTATMWGIPYDDLETWRGPYPPEVFAAQFEKISEGWRPGIVELQAAVEKSPRARRKEAQADLRLALAAAINFQSVANQARFILARDALAKSGNALSPEEHQRLRVERKRYLESEIVLARQLFTLTREDSRIGFEPTCQYFYLPLDLVEKVVNCRWLLEHGEE